jgi:hypothetical protein
MLLTRSPTRTPSASNQPGLGGGGNNLNNNGGGSGASGPSGAAIAGIALGLVRTPFSLRVTGSQ